MICSKCGVKNKDTNTRCFYCGAPITKASPKVKPVQTKRVINEFYVEDSTPSDEIEILPEVENIEEVTPIEETPIETSEESIIEEIEVIEETKIAEAVEEVTIIETVDETETVENVQTAEQIEITEDAEVGEQILIAEVADVVEENETAEEEHPETEEAPKKDKKKILLLTFIPIVAILLIVLGLFVFKDTLFNNASTEDALTTLNIQAPEITAKTDENGESYIDAKFYGKAGDILNLKCNGKTYTFTNDTLELKLYLKDLFNKEHIFTENSVTVDLNVYYTRKKDYSCKTSPIQLTVPDAITDLDTTPKQIINSDELYDLSFWVEKGSKVTVDDEEITVNALGIVNYQLSAPEESTTYKVIVTQPYRRQAIKTISFIKNEAPFNFTVSSEISDIHSENTIKVTYTVDNGAEIRSNLPVASITATELPNTYDVVFDISSCKYGFVNLSLTAKTPDASVKKTITFKYWPEKSLLEASSIPFSQELLTSPVFDKNIAFDNVIFTEVIDAYKVKGNINGIEIIFDIYGIIDEIELNTPYNVIAQLEENDSPIFKIWYASDPTISDDVLD